MNPRNVQPIHFGPPARALQGWLHRPAAGKGQALLGAGVVLCNPIGDDDLRAHRPLRHLAEGLAAAGFHVLRFDFLGTGDSSGDEREPGRVEAWHEDIGLAIEALQARSGVSRIALVGLRLGATLAASVASRRRDAAVASVVLWSPCPDGQSYVSESLRQHKMTALLDPEGFTLRAADPGRAGGKEALGFFLTDETIADLSRVDLGNLDGPPAPRVLILGPLDSAKAIALPEKLRAAGAEVDVRSLAHRFLTMTPHQATLPADELREIVAWLSGQFMPEPGFEATEAAAAEDPLPGEKQYLFGEGGRLFGIVSEPAVTSPRQDPPVIILLNAGTTHRIGAHRFYVKAARAWAAIGYRVMRLDLSGIGDSEVEPGTVENVTYPRRATADVKAAMDLMGDGKFILAGLCSGADIAFQTALADSRVTGAVMMNPRTFLVHELQSVESHDRARGVQKSFLNPENWKRLSRGHINVGQVLRSIGVSLEGAFLALRTRIATSSQEAMPTVPALLRGLAGRGVDTFLLVSERDPGVDYVDAHFGAEMRSLAGIPGFRRADFKGTDHTFTSCHAQQVVLDTITEHLTRITATP